MHPLVPNFILKNSLNCFSRLYASVYAYIFGHFALFLSAEVIFDYLELTLEVWKCRLADSAAALAFPCLCFICVDL